jgi:hypothetical protein
LYDDCILKNHNVAFACATLKIGTQNTHGRNT